MVSSRQRTGRGRGGRGGRGRGRGGVGREGTSSPTTDEIGDALNGMIDVQMQNNNDDNDDDEQVAPTEPPINDDDASMEVDATAAANSGQQLLRRPQRQPRQQPPPEPEYPPPPPPIEGRTIPPPRFNPPKSISTYRSTFLRFMQYTNKIAYPKDYVFSIEELAAITPQHVHAWFCYKTFGKDNYEPGDKPMFAMQNAIKGWKKHISFFLNAITNQPWNDQLKTGNPTKSTIINDLIAIVGQKETRGLGLPSNQDRTFKPHELVQILDTLRSSNDANLRYRYPAMLTFMFHLISRGDDAAHVYKSSLCASSIYDGALTTRLRWSKNVRERRDCPPQIMLGSMNPIYCVYLSLAIFLEQWIGGGAGIGSQWLFSDGITTPQSSEEDMDKEVNRNKKAL